MNSVKGFLGWFLIFISLVGMIRLSALICLNFVACSIDVSMSCINLSLLFGIIFWFYGFDFFCYCSTFYFGHFGLVYAFLHFSLQNIVALDGFQFCLLLWWLLILLRQWFSDFDCSLPRLRWWWVLFVKKVWLSDIVWNSRSCFGKSNHKAYSIRICNHCSQPYRCWIPFF